jgi:hypothetical protein
VDERETRGPVLMSMEIVNDAASFDAELVQLPEVSPLALKSNPAFVEKLFEQWLSLPDSNRQVLACNASIISMFCLHSELKMLLLITFPMRSLMSCFIGKKERKKRKKESCTLRED